MYGASLLRQSTKMLRVCYLRTKRIIETASLLKKQFDMSSLRDKASFTLYLKECAPNEFRGQPTENLVETRVVPVIRLTGYPLHRLSRVDLVSGGLGIRQTSYPVDSLSHRPVIRQNDYLVDRMSFTPAIWQTCYPEDRLSRRRVIQQTAYPIDWLSSRPVS